MHRRSMMGFVAMGAAAGCTPVDAETAEPRAAVVESAPAVEDEPASEQAPQLRRGGSLSVEVIPRY